MTDFDLHGIAKRIREVIGYQTQGDAAAAIARLSVDAESFRTSIDHENPDPSADVIAAVVHSYGVDPCWLLTGYYDRLTHQRARDAAPSEIPALVRRMLGGKRDDPGTLGS